MLKRRSSHEVTKNTKSNTKYKLFFVVYFVAFVSSWQVLAQEGHPLTGTWIGDVGQRHVTLALEWDGKNVIGTINPGPNAAQIKNVTVDPATWTIHIDAEGKDRVAVD